MKRRAVLSCALAILAVLSCGKETDPSSAGPSPSPTASADPDRELEDLNEAAFKKLNEVMVWLDKNDPRGRSSSPEELAKIDREMRDVLRESLSSATTKEQRTAALKTNLELVLMTINENLSSAADELGLSPPGPVPVTIETLRVSLPATSGK